MENQELNQEDQRILKDLEEDGKISINTSDYKISDKLKEKILHSDKLDDQQKITSLTVLNDSSPAKTLNQHNLKEIEKRRKIEQEKQQKINKQKEKKEKIDKVKKDVGKNIDKTIIGAKSIIEKGFSGM